MFLSKIEGDRFKKQHYNDKIYETHQDMWSLFDNNNSIDRVRDFLYFHHNGVVYMVSKRKPVLPTNVDFKIQSKIYRLGITDGMTLLFDVRLNAQVVRKDKKLSIVTAMAHKLRDDGEEFNWNIVAYESSKEWLESHSDEYGFRVLDHQVMAFEQIKFRKPESGIKVVYNTLDLHGALKVTDCDLFLEILHTGIGRGRAFGCGLMLVAPYKGF